MSTPTIHDTLCAGLLKLGYKPVPARSRFATFKHPESEKLVFVGSHGALRRGRSASASHSMEGTEAYRHIKQIGERTLIEAELQKLSPEQIQAAMKDANIDYEDQSKQYQP